MQEMKITPEIISQHGLKPDEYDLIEEILGREPSFTELGIFSVMWSEHCSYKNSKPLLKLFPTTGPSVLQGPGENAGVVAFDEHLAICFKMESHNHPSAVEPYQGAATGVGGILRDIFTMGARPVALVDCLFFGEPGEPKVDRIVNGVVHGIADYGNCVGVPTVNGMVTFSPAFETNCLVNAMAVGVMNKEDLTLARTDTPGNKVVYYGNATGRDGVHGATFASEELSDETKEQRSAVQVGDPFMGKKILEATLELIKAGLVEGLQDMGAAGLTCSGCEIAGRGKLGMKLNLDDVPQRALNMSAYEMMLSESQERMLAVVSPEHIDEALAILDKWETNPAVVGEVTEDGLLTVYHHGETVAQVPALKISNESPVYHREDKAPEGFDTRAYGKPSWSEQLDIKDTLLELLSHPNVASKAWIHEQYDTMVQTNTVVGPGAGAAVLRVNGSEKLLAISSGVDPMKVAIDPYYGAQYSVTEAALNLLCVGARPLGLTDNLNFGNPEKPEQFWYFKRAVEGIADAARALAIPVTGGNVSLYNESSTGPIWPTPTIGMVGAIKNETHLIKPGFQNVGDHVYTLGRNASSFAGSLLSFLKDGKSISQAVEKDHSNHFACRMMDLQNLMLDLIDRHVLSTAQDVSEGGLAVALAECSIFSPSSLGVDVSDAGVSAEQLFGEPGGQVLVAVSDDMLAAFKQTVNRFEEIEVKELGVVTEDSSVKISKDVLLSVGELTAARSVKPYVD